MPRTVSGVQRPKSVQMSVIVTAMEAEQIDGLIREGRYLARSDFVREAVRKTLQDLNGPHREVGVRQECVSS